jgi:hypothetical protein
MKHLFAVIIVASSLATAFAQTRPAFTLGTPIETVHKIFGEPLAYWNESTKHAITDPAEARIARKLGHDLHDIYQFKTASNAYSFQLRYEPDTTQSRLNPVERLVAVNIEIDKPVDDVKLVLADLPEAASLCSRECTIFKPDVDVIHVQPAVDLSPAEYAEAALFAHMLDIDRFSEKAGDQIKWVPSFIFRLESYLKPFGSTNKYATVSFGPDEKGGSFIGISFEHFQAIGKWPVQ